jgi:hypothetical protein
VRQGLGAADGNRSIRRDPGSPTWPATPLRTDALRSSRVSATCHAVTAGSGTAPRLASLRSCRPCRRTTFLPLSSTLGAALVEVPDLAAERTS